MNIKMPAFCLVVANCGILIIFVLGIYAPALSDASSKPVPVYGGWKEISGRFMTETDDLKFVGKPANYSFSTFSYVGFGEANDALGHLRTDLANLTFVRSSLRISINSSTTITFLLGMYHKNWAATTNGSITDAPPNPGFSCVGFSISSNILKTTLTWDKPILGDRCDGDMGHVIINGKSYAHLFFFILPVAAWTGKPEYIDFKYSETWKFTPLGHYDNSTIENGKTVLSSLWAVWVSLGVSDIVSVALLIGLWLASYPKVPEDLKSMAAQEKKKEDQS